MKNIIIGLSLIFALLTIGGCNDGPAEEMGEELDNAIDEIDDEIRSGN